MAGLFVLPCLAVSGLSGFPGLPGLGSEAWAGGMGDGALRLVVTVNGRADSATRPPAVRVGAEVVKRYRLLNRGEAHLHGVRVDDPGVPRGAVRCPGRTLAALGELTCVARFRALAGEHRAAARVEGDVPSLRKRIGATVRSGYAGVLGGLRLSERIAVAAVAGKGRGGNAGRRAGSGAGAGAEAGAAAVGSGLATVTYTVTNFGNRPVHSVRVDDPSLGTAAACGGSGRALAPGASVRCTATVRRPYGTHRSTGLASGSDRVRTYRADGKALPAPLLTARSSAVFTLAGPPRAVAPPGPPRPSRPPRPGSGGAPGARAVPELGVPATGPAGGALAGAPEAPGDAAVEAGAVGVGAEGAVAVEAPVVPVAPVAPLPVPARPDAAPDAAVDAVPPPAVARRAAALDDEGFLGRLRRRGREGQELGVVVILLLILIPAAIAAALLGNRRS